MLKELLDVVSVGLTVTAQGLNTLSTGVKVIDNVVNTAEKSTAILDAEAGNMQAWHDIRIKASNAERRSLLEGLDL
jgi:hypothetical protein